MTDETPPTSPSEQPERSWAPETGWPAPPSTPTWAEPPAEEGSDEDEYDAWLDAQDLPAEPDEPEAPAAAEASSPGELEQEAYEEQAGEQQGDEPADARPSDDEPGDEEPADDEPRYDEAAAPVELTPEPVAAEAATPDVADLPSAAVEQAPVVAEPVHAAEPAGAEPAAAADEHGDEHVEPAAEADGVEGPLEPAPVEAPVVVPDALEAAATPLAIETEPAPETVPEPPAVPEQPAAADRTPAPEAVAVEEDQLPAVPASRSAVPLVAPLAVLVVLLVALTAVLGVWSAGTRHGGATERARREALAAARNASRLLFSYDYRHLDKDFAAGRAVTTGTFATDYQRTTTKIVSDVAPRYKAVVVADVSDAGVVTATASTVQVLVFVNQSSTSSLASGQKVTQSRLTMTLVHKHGTWLVSKVNAF